MNSEVYSVMRFFRNSPDSSEVAKSGVVLYVHVDRDFLLKALPFLIAIFAGSGGTVAVLHNLQRGVSDVGVPQPAVDTYPGENQDVSNQCAHLHVHKPLDLV